jgi:hypothetical protein
MELEGWLLYSDELAVGPSPELHEFTQISVL